MWTWHAHGVDTSVTPRKSKNNYSYSNDYWTSDKLTSVMHVVCTVNTYLGFPRIECFPIFISKFVIYFNIEGGVTICNLPYLLSKKIGLISQILGY